MEDDLRPEYDLKNLRVRRLGSKRTSFAGQTVRLDPDVAEVFPDADAVNEAREDKEDLMQDFISIITSFCARIYGLRRQKRRTECIIKCLEGEQK